MIAEVSFLFIRGLYTIASYVDTVLQNSGIGVLGSVSGFVGLLITVLVANLAVGGTIYYFVRSRR